MSCPWAGPCASSRRPTDELAAAQGRYAAGFDRRDHAVMFDVDAFLDDCIRANHEDKPQLAIKELLERTMSDPGAVAEALPPQRAEITPLHRSPDLTVLK